MKYIYVSRYIKTVLTFFKYNYKKNSGYSLAQKVTYFNTAYKVGLQLND